MPPKITKKQGNLNTFSLQSYREWLVLNLAALFLFRTGTLGAGTGDGFS